MFDFKGELKHLKAKSPGLISAASPSSQDSIFPNMLACGPDLSTRRWRSHSWGPTACSSGRNGDLSGSEGRNKAECAVEWEYRPYQCPIIYRGSGSSPLSGTQIPTFPLLQVRVSITGCKVNPCSFLPHSLCAPGRKAEKNIEMMEYQGGGGSAESLFESGTLRGRELGEGTGRFWPKVELERMS